MGYIAKNQTEGQAKRMTRIKNLSSVRTNQAVRNEKLSSKDEEKREPAQQLFIGWFGRFAGSGSNNFANTHFMERIFAQRA